MDVKIWNQIVGSYFFIRGTWEEALKKQHLGTEFDNECFVTGKEEIKELKENF